VITQNLIIYKFNTLYHILVELGLDFNFKITFSDTKDSLNEKLIYHNNSLVITNSKHVNIGNHFVLNNSPINISKLIEKINIEFLKLQFKNQSQMKVNNYNINLNSREMIKNDTKLKLTEKEINTISYLAKSKKPVSINELQAEVWSYQSDIETHTVETHIYRLRKKISNTFNDKEFIISKKNGYQIK
jgi:DNA polymerase III delta prime subunit